MKCDRRDFLGMSATAALGSFLPKAFSQNTRSDLGSVSGVSLKVDGNADHGYRVGILFRGAPIISNDSNGISAIFQNGDRSLEDRIEDWKATSWAGNESKVTLNGDAHLVNMNATVRVEVIYEVVAQNIVRKSIRLHQSDMFMMFYQITNRITPAGRPAKFWSFDQLDCEGGPLREYFPAAGFRTANQTTVGLLTDAGFRNQWSRMFRRDGKPIKPAAAQIPDPNLYVVASAEERSRGIYYVQQTFGEELQQLPGGGATPVSLPEIQEWTYKGSPIVKKDGPILELSIHEPEEEVIIPFAAKAGDIFSVALEYRSNFDVSIAIWDVDEKLNQLHNFNQFNDRIPSSPDKWATFQSTVFVSAIFGKGAALVLSLPTVEKIAGGRLEVRSLKLSRIPTKNRPYHSIEMDKPVEINTFIFANEDVRDTIRGYRLASQTQLADALGFKGGETEKVLYADLMMLCWNAGTETFRPMLAPSIWYSAAGEMYLRDSFFALNGIHNKELNEQVFNLWAENQGENGAINTLIEPEMTNLERKSNDSTPLWLMWALLNKRRFGTIPPMDKVKLAAQYCLETYDPKGDGNCTAQFVMGQLDIVAYPDGTSIICQNQGLLAVLLSVIRALEIPGVSDTVSDQHIGLAEEIYRSYYDPVRKFILPARNITDAIGFAELFPEYLSLWLFNRKILTDEMVLNHLDRIPVMMPRAESPFPEMGGTVRPIFIGLTEQPRGWRFFTETWHPMASDSYAKTYANGEMDGVYYNGGSWMRIEVCGYVVGKMHGWRVADKAIRNRMWAEINVNQEFPASHEYLATDPHNPFFGSHLVFAWNSFVLQALEKAGMRSPSMDPDYRPVDDAAKLTLQMR